MKEMIIYISIPSERLPKVLEEVAMRRAEYIEGLESMATYAPFTNWVGVFHTWPANKHQELIKSEHESLEVVMYGLNPKTKALIAPRIKEYGAERLEHARIIFEYTDAGKPCSH